MSHAPSSAEMGCVPTEKQVQKQVQKQVPGTRYPHKIKKESPLSLPALSLPPQAAALGVELDRGDHAHHEPEHEPHARLSRE